MGFGNQGTWVSERFCAVFPLRFFNLQAPLRVNEVFRVAKTDAGGHFAPHRDSGFLETEDVRSVFTLLVYLNAAYIGGHTDFLDEVTAANFNYLSSQNEFTLQDSDGVVSRVIDLEPVTGLGVLFDHSLLHTGRSVVSGSKYVLRTDVLFHRIDAQRWAGGANYLENPLFHKAEALYQRSIELQLQDDPACVCCCCCYFFFHFFAIITEALRLRLWRPPRFKRNLQHPAELRTILWATRYKMPSCH